MRAATQQQQSRAGGGGGSNNSNQTLPHQRNFANAHSRKGSAASSASSSSTGTGGGYAAAAASAGGTASNVPSTNSNAATSNQPGSAAAAAAPATTPLASALGSQLRLTLNAGTQNKERSIVEGQLWCYDPSYGLVVLKTSPLSTNNTTRPTSPSSSSSPSSTDNYRLVRLSNVANVTVLQSATPDIASAFQNVPLKPIDANRLQERESEAIREETKRIANEPPPGVSELGKSLYEALGKTLPVRWANRTIVVMDEVLVEPPYASNDQCIKSNNAQRKERVMKVITGETARLQRTQPEILKQ